MSFRTFGWFGPRCPRTFQLVQTGTGSFGATWGHMDMYDYSTKSFLSGFPLEIASKIYWEAGEITLDASVTAQYTAPNGALVTRTLSAANTVTWGSGPSPRPFITTAKDMLCFINGGTFSSITGAYSRINTNFSILDNSGLPTRLIYSTEGRPYFQNEKLFAPFVLNIEGNIAQQVNHGNRPAQLLVSPRIFTSDVTRIVGNAEWFTPWGNVLVPMYWSTFSNTAVQFVSGFMRVTVTAADPATRYA